MTNTFQQQLEIMKTRPGFIAALDQSGGSTPKALAAYGVTEDQYTSEEEMFNAVHTMRQRIMTNESFTSDHIVGVILFEHTFRHQVESMPTSKYLWEQKQLLPFLKIDKGLLDENDSVRLMRDIPGLTALLKEAAEQDVFGTKARSFIMGAGASGIHQAAAQQFAVGKEVLACGLMPILEPEIDIHASDKAECEAMLKDQLLMQLDQLADGQQIMLKLTLPEEPNFYQELVEHPKVLKVVALSGGYSREEANQRLSKNTGIIASFSRALSQALRADQSEKEFTTALHSATEAIYKASIT